MTTIETLDAALDERFMGDLRRAAALSPDGVAKAVTLQEILRGMYPESPRAAMLRAHKEACSIIIA